MQTTEIKQLSQKYLGEMQKIRRKLHEQPELSNHEHKTAERVIEVLAKHGIKAERMVGTGVVGMIKGQHPGKTVLLRADMDALPIEEEAEVPYKSKVSGVMHACGHDGHTAGLLGAAMILNELKQHIHGNIKLMFQPAEETDGGAERMIAAGILENPRVDAAFGVHLWGPTPQGMIEVKHGAMMAAPDTFTLKIIGKGGHAAMPHLCVDPINIAMQIINSAQNIISRRVDPVKPAVISFCRIHGGEATNVIPQEVELAGTIRTLDATVRDDVAQMLGAHIHAICAAQGATYQLDIAKGYPPVINDDAMTDIVACAAQKIVGANNVRELHNPNMGGEDFSYLCEHVPASFFFVGIAENGKPKPIHHHPAFTWNDEVLEQSAATLAQVAVDFLHQGK